MKIKSLGLRGLINSLGIALYAAVVVVLINHASSLSDKMLGFLAPLSFLILFVLSAAITGALFIGEPILLYLDNKKKEAVKLFLYTVLWMAALLVLIGIIIVLKYSRLI